MAEKYRYKGNIVIEVIVIRVGRLYIVSCFPSAFFVIGGLHPELSVALTLARVSFVGMKVIFFT